MEESISGFKTRGTWGDVVEHGERITTALREASATGSYPEAFEDWVEWRPKMHEQIESDVSEKTADQASVGESKGEAEGKSADQDLQSAGERLTESYEHIEENDRGGAVEKWQDTIDYVARAADTVSRKALRKLENTVYQRVMTQVAPYYFDNELISANIQRLRSQDEFVFEVNVNDEDLKDEVADYLRTFEDFQRWHVDTEKDVETVEAVEGVEAPDGTDSPDDAAPNSQTN
jgi:sarcosine oxidase delta subunit